MIIKARFCLCLTMGGLVCAPGSPAAVTTFFNAAQRYTNVVSGSTSDTLQFGNYLLTHSLDKWWYPTISLGPGTPTGRYLKVTLPTGLEAQSVTAGPNGLVTNQAKARISITRADGTAFSLTAFTARLLANTAGAGGAFELMPKLQGEDALPDPIMFNASGYAGSTFSYRTNLAGYDSYDLTLYVDFAVTELTVEDSDPPAPPELFKSRTAPGEVTFYWTMDAPGYALQASSDLTSAAFTNVTVQPDSQARCHWVTLPATNAQGFFRLAN